MKTRTVIITLECETSSPLKELKDFFRADHGYFGTDALRVRQVTASVAQPSPSKTKYKLYKRRTK